jgi:cytochrome c-type biogenesis protein CcmH/NrfG
MPWRSSAWWLGWRLATCFAGRNRPRRRHLHPPYPSSLPPQVPWAARRQAWILLEQLKTDPNNTDLLSKVGDLYQATHQFKEAAAYYDKALQVDPKNVPTRTKLASCFYYQGDVDGAISQLQQSLQYDPKDANSLFNLGMIKLQGKKDTKGALAAWQLLLKSNPQLSAERKAMVQKLIADVQKQSKG